MTSLSVSITGCAIMGAQAPSSLFERPVLRFEVRDEGAVVGRFAHRWSLAQPLELITYRRHPLVDLLSQRLV